MKAYKSYMDKLNLGRELHKKIARGEAKATDWHPGSHALRFVGAAACVAALLVAVWVIQGAFGDESALDGLVGGHADNTEILYSLNDAKLPEPRGEHELHSLTFNAADQWMLAYRMPNDIFRIGIPDEELQDVFYGFNTILSTKEYYHKSLFATASYGDDGSLLSVVFVEDVVTLDAWGFMQTYGLSIEVGERGHNLLSADVIHRGEAIVSDVHGVQVTAFFYVSIINDVFLSADFVVDGIPHHITLERYSLSEGKERITKIVNWLIVTGPPDLSLFEDQYIPESYMRMDIAQAKLDPVFGKFLPTNVPRGFFPMEAVRVSDSEWGDFIHVSWFAFDFFSDMDTFLWVVQIPREDDFERAVSVSDKHKYDVSLYPMPWVDTVPQEYIGYFPYPVFLADEVSLETIHARTFWVDEDWVEFGDSPGWRTFTFSVLLDDVVIRLSARGVPAELLWEMLDAVIN